MNIEVGMEKDVCWNDLLLHFVIYFFGFNGTTLKNRDKHNEKKKETTPFTQVILYCLVTLMKKNNINKNTPNKEPDHSYEFFFCISEEKNFN